MPVKNPVLPVLCFMITLLVGGATQADILSNQPIEKVRELTRDRYDTFYPLYVEGCSMSQLQKLDGYNGGSVGHAVAYVKGLCRDNSAAYPRVKVCQPGHYTAKEEMAGIGFNDMHNPNAGLGFSANKEFANVNWVAIPGRDLFFQGNLPMTGTVTPQVLNDVRDRLVEIGTHRGILFSEKPTNPSRKDVAHYEANIAMKSIDTDVAFGLARSYHCVRVPIKESMLPRIATYLNSLNDMYFKNQNYHWNVINNNCTHLVDNILAKVGFWRTRDTTGGITGDLKKIENLKNLAVPAMSMIQIAKRANLMDFNNLGHIFWPGYAYSALVDEHWYTAQHGSLIDIVTARPQKLNKVFKFVPPEQIALAVGIDEARKLARNPEFVDIRANLEFFKRRYESYSVPTIQQPLQWSLESVEKVFNSLKIYMNMQLADVHQKLSDLNSNYEVR